jgi:hypothetical protein
MHRAPRATLSATVRRATRPCTVRLRRRLPNLAVTEVGAACVSAKRMRTTRPRFDARTRRTLGSAGAASG